MPLLVPNTGEVYMLQNIVGKNATANTLYLKLYNNNYTPTETDVVSNYSEATFTGYANLALTGASWTVATNVAGFTNASYSIQTFSSTADQTSNNIYGYYITSGVSGQLVWAERFTDGPYPISTNGDQIKVTPYIELA